mgnify:CR=1 FL=1
MPAKKETVEYKLNELNRLRKIFGAEEVETYPTDDPQKKFAALTKCFSDIKDQATINTWQTDALSAIACFLFDLGYTANDCYPMTNEKIKFLRTPVPRDVVKTLFALTGSWLISLPQAKPSKQYALTATLRGAVKKYALFCFPKNAEIYNIGNYSKK